MVLTIGHFTLPLQRFVDLLKARRIEGLQITYPLEPLPRDGESNK